MVLTDREERRKWVAKLLRIERKIPRVEREHRRLLARLRFLDEELTQPLAREPDVGE